MKFRQAYDMLMNESVFRPVTDNEAVERMMKSPGRMYKAIDRHSLADMRRIIDDGYDVNSGAGGYPPLTYACVRNFRDGVRLLLDRGADPNIRGPGNDFPLIDAIISASFEIVMMLVEAGADVNLVTDSGYSPLKYAAQTSDYSLARYLMMHGADPDLTGKNMSELPLANAKRHDNQNMIDILEKKIG
jgi:ankyrin repeat protein